MAGTQEDASDGARWSGGARKTTRATSHSEDDVKALPRLLTASELAAQLGLTLARTYAMARNGLVPTVWLGRQLRFEPNAIRAWLTAGGTPLRRPPRRKQRDAEQKARGPHPTG
jgi:excisionase family DNA binding protein